MKKFRAPILAPLLIGALAMTTGCARHHQNAPVPQATASPGYAAVARGRIDIEGRLLQLSSSQPGVVTIVLAHPGDHVLKGQPLAKLQSDNAEVAITIAEGRVKLAEADAQIAAVRLDVERKRAMVLSQAAAAGADTDQNATDAASQVLQISAQQAAAQAAITIASGQLAEARNNL
jgi:multidrug efflux pump subunit AcrA (membrane-fusion protein)